MSDECKLCFSKILILLVLVSTLYIGCWLVIGTLEWRIHKFENENQDLVSSKLARIMNMEEHIYYPEMLKLQISSSKMMSDNYLHELDVDNSKLMINFIKSNRNKQHIRDKVNENEASRTFAKISDVNTMNEEILSKRGNVSGSEDGSDSGPGNVSEEAGSRKNRPYINKRTNIFSNHNDFLSGSLASVLDLEKNKNASDRLMELLQKKIDKRDIKDDAEILVKKIRESLLSLDMKKSIENALVKMADEIEEPEGTTITN